jgi:ribosomal protein S18 acetylase RimI-like enzyme
VHENRVFNEFQHRRQGFFGFFEALDDAEAVAALFAEGERWLAARGCASVLGPVSFSVYEQVGLLLDAFDLPPVVLCPYNPPYYARLLEGLGYGREVDWFAYRFLRGQPLPVRWVRVAERALRRRGVTVRHPRMRHWHEELALVRGLFNEAWAENWSHAPLSQDEWAVLAEELRLVVRPELCLILSVGDVPVGFSVTLPDLNQALKRARGCLFPFGLLRLLWEARRIRGLRTIAMGVLKEYRNRGYAPAMVVETVRNGLRLGYERCDCSLIVETNTAMVELLRDLGAERYKTFRVYRKALHGAH